MDYDAAMIRIALYTLGFILFLIIGNIITAASTKKKEQFKEYDRLHEKAVRKSLDARRLETARKYLNIMESANVDSKECIPSVAEEAYLADIAEARERVSELEMDDWERKAEPHLQEFVDCWDQLVHGDLEKFRDVEVFFKLKQRCISEWQSYFAVDVSDYKIKIFPKRYLREWMGEKYDPCMDSHETLEKKLDEYVQHMRPEQKRKNRLYELLVKHVQEQKTVAQAELLKTEFPGYIEAEIKCCYNELIRRNRLVKTKLGNRWFVSLSDKELSKKRYTSERKELTPEEFASSIK